MTGNPGTPSLAAAAVPPRLGDTPLAGTLHIFVAFDWGERIDLDHVQRLVPAKWHSLPRRRRTPPSIAYRPAPLRLALDAIPIDAQELGAVQVPADMTLFDFGAVSVALHIPWRLPPARLSALAASLAEPERIVQAVRSAIEPIQAQLTPAILETTWSEQTEEYFVFEISPGGPLAPAQELLDAESAWLAGLVRLEAGPLSSGEVQEALRLRLSYTPDDLFLPEWSAALLIDSECDETLEAIELANLQLLEFRHLDTRLDDRLAQARRLIHPLAHSPLPFWRTHGRPLRVLGELRVQAHAMFERTTNVLKLVGDQYLARVYRLLAMRFHLEAWEASIRESLDTIEGVYQVLSDQSAMFRAETLEMIIIALIALEILMALLARH